MKIENESFIDKFQDIKCDFFDKIDQIKNNNEHLILYGVGEWGKRILALLMDKQIALDAVVVDDEYYVENKCIYGYEVLKLSDILNSLNNINVIIGIPDQKYDKSKLIGKVKSILDYDIVSGCQAEYGLWDYEFLEKNREQFNNMYDLLADKKSKNILNAFIMQKLTGDYKYSKEVCEANQYFPEDIISINDCKNFVDCGAYNGDSYLELINFENKFNGKFIDNIYLFEMDKNNYNELIKNVSDDKRCKAYNCGVSDKEEVLYYSSDNTSSMLGVSGDNTALVKRIDSVLEGKEITYLKMDIEGAEMSALYGAKETIIKNTPVMAICVYHKKRDLIDIIEYIASLNENYKFYLRWHHRRTIELVLYVKKA